MLIRRALVALICSIGLLFVAACSGADSAEEPAPSPTPTSPASPLEEATGMSSDPGRRNQTFVTMQRRANESAVQCMATAGFTYFVQPVSGGFPRVGDGSRGWVEVNGLGVATALIGLSELDASESLDAAAANSAYTATLSPEQTLAYDTALIGTGPPSADAGTAGFSPDGCWGQAYFDVFRRLEFWGELNTDLAELNLRIEQDPRVAGLMETWSGCMQDKGHRYADRGEMVDDLFARLLSVDYVETETGLELSEPAAVNELLAIEIDVAVDDFDCGQTIADPLEVIRSDYERRFVDDNRSRISALAATSQD